MVVRFGPFTLDAAQRRCSRHGTDVHLSPKAFDLLLVLASAAPRVIPKIELHERLWPATFVSDATLTGLVKELRRALGNRAAHVPWIRTAHGVGYALDDLPGVEPPVDALDLPEGDGHSGEFAGAPVLVQFGPFALDAARRRLSRRGVEVHLSPKAFDLLRLLAAAAPDVVAKTDLHQRLWPTTFVSEATLTGLIKELRRALGNGDSPPLIRTAYGIGYALEPSSPPPRRDAAHRAHWMLVKGRRVVLHAGENRIGRDPESQVWLDSRGVSRRHACIVIGQDGVTLEDCGSKNGTMVDGVRITGAVALTNGDCLQFGMVVATYGESARSLSTQTLAASPSRPVHS